MNEPLAQAIIEEAKKRLFEEGSARIEICLNQLTQEQIWWKPNENSNSIGNLVLHLCGNVRQWVISGLGGKEDQRERDLEFLPNQNLDTSVLVQKLKQLETDVLDVLENISKEELLKIRSVQIYEESGVSILIHVIEHFSYHVGQISWISKMLLNKQLGYYEGQEL